MTHTTLKAIPITEACDILDFWIIAPWPMNRDQTYRYATQLGWTTKEEEGEINLVNEIAGLNRSFVLTSVMPPGNMATIDFPLTDIGPRDATNEITTLLSDHFTLYCREAVTRWGQSKQYTLKSGSRVAQWDLEPGKGRISLTLNARAVYAAFTTPEYAQVLRKIGD